MTTHLQSGQLVADRFVIVRFIAEGGMGEVYEAQDQVLGERVALKFLSRRNLGDEEVTLRFRREIQLARKVTHANVCRIFDVFQHHAESGPPEFREITFVTMELLSGETLEDYLEEHGPMEEEEALPILRQMADALTAAHAAGVIHRDFKSNNVMLIHDTAAPHKVPRVVVTDFGLARTFGPADAGPTPLTGETKIVGTPEYMAPEQLRGEEVSPASDVYALGVVLFEMVTGAKPYDADNQLSLLLKRVSEPPRRPQTLAPTLSERWEKVILDCMANDPKDRPADPYQVFSALGSLPLNDPSSPAIQRPDLMPQRRPKRSGRWFALAAVLALLVTLIGFRATRRTLLPPLGPENFNPVQLTTDASLEIDPAFSPDGTKLAYSSNRSGTFALYIRDLSPGGTQERMTFDGPSFEPTWSPDGTQIAFHAPEHGGLRILPATGGTPRPLTTFGSRPAWSPDGEYIVFQSNSAPLLSDTTAPALALSTLWIVSVETGAQRQLTAPGTPIGGHAAANWSPAGNRIVFTASQRGASEIWSIDRDGEGLGLVTRQHENSYDPVYAADGASIFFSATVRQVNGLWQIPVDRRGSRPAGPPRQVANLGLASIRQLALAADGNRMAYTALSTRSNLWALPMDPETAKPAGPAQSLTTGGGRNSRPAFDRSGQRLAFDRYRTGVNVDIWALDTNGKNLAQLTRHPLTNTVASWLPGGKGLAYLALRDSRRGFWALDLATDGESLLTELPPEADWAKLSPDGRRLAYHARDAGPTFDLIVRDLDSGENQILTAAQSFSGFPFWSPDGAWLGFQSRRGDDSHVMVIASEGGEPVQLTRGQGLNWPYSFAPDNDKVAFAAQRDEGSWNLWWVSRRTGEEVQLTDEGRDDGYVRYPAWSPDGTSIIYEQAETTGDIWMVETAPSDG